MRYPFVAILVVAVGAMVGGAGSFAAIGEWVADLSADVRAGLGLVGWIPGPVTVWRVLTVVDRAALEAAIGAWVRAWVEAADAALSRSRQRRARVHRVIAVDGKAMRATCHGQAGVHLLGAFDHARGVVLAQVDVDAKTTEISVVLNVSGPDRGLDRRRRHRGCDARADRARRLPAGPVEGAALEGHPVGHTATGRGHGRIEKRTLKAVTVPAGLGFPHTAQAIQVTRTSHPINKRGKDNGKRHRLRRETVYAIATLPAEQAGPAELAAWLRGQWSTANRRHWVRDVTFGEDLHQARTGSGPQIMAALRNLVVSLLRLAGHTNIARALHQHARHPDQTIALVTSANTTSQ